MKYYLIVGEASGDLHASCLMESLKKEDPEAEFRFFGGDLMTAVGGTRVRHYKELAYMGFIPVLLHLPTIFRNMRLCKRDILRWKPDAVILVDYPGFNLSIAKYVKRIGKLTSKQVDKLNVKELSANSSTRQLVNSSTKNIKVYYYISPKIWAWKEWRIHSIRHNVDEMFSILPFEVPFYEEKHHYPIHYVGNPTVDEVNSFRKTWHMERDSFYHHNTLSEEKPLLALLCGSRKQEIKDNLPAMLEATKDLANRYTIVVAGMSTIGRDYYQPFLEGYRTKLIFDQTYGLLCEAQAALVTSGTATLETAIFNVPQVVCYETPIKHIVRFAFRHIIKVRYISLVNLIADREVVPELLADRFSVENIRTELARILPGGEGRQQMLDGYALVHDRLGTTVAPDNAARIMVEKLSQSS